MYPDDEKSELTSWSVEPLEYGKYMCDIFDYWVKHDVGEYFVSLFDSTLANYCGVNPGTCVYAETCGVNAVVEHNGDVFPCDHFVYQGFKMGNLNETSLEKLMSSDMITSFGIDKRNSLPSQCIRCRYFFTCHGECPKHRFSKTKTGEHGLNSLCDGLFYFYSHVEPYMIKMKEFVFERKEAKLIMDYDKDSF